MICSIANVLCSAAETIDFDISTVTINPLYAVPSPIGGMDVILRRDERIARLAFQNLKDVLKFQQAVTGFKTWASHVQYVSRRHVRPKRYLR